MSKIINLLTLFLPPVLILIYKKILFKFKKKDDSNKLRFDYENNLYNRTSFIQKAISMFDSDLCKYLEIGVCTNEVFNTIHLDLRNKFGVDPAKGGTHRMTSDDFFKNNNQKFNVIFIDGMHTYEQCQKDCINSLSCLTADGIIIFHDFLPRNALEENVPPKQRTWSGDVWKVAVEINNSNNLDFKIVNIDRGVGILKPKKNYTYLKMPNLKNQHFDHFYKDHYPKLPVVSVVEGLNFLKKK
jgi:hypothetical protein